MNHHPIQTVINLEDNLIISSNSSFYNFNNKTSTLISSATSHTGLIKLTAIYTDTKTNQQYLIATGEDKLLTVSSLPDLTLLSKRELVKRANALEMTADGVIVVGDKFGDVYTYPLIAPPIVVLPEGVEAPKALPILGHVSMLNTLALIPSSATSGGRALIATGDRDEHIRVSRFPKGHNIEGYLWGSKSFVTALLYIAPTSNTPALLLSAGGDHTIQTFNLSTSSLHSSFPIASHIFPYLLVTPIRPGVSETNQQKKADKKAAKKLSRSEKTGYPVVVKTDEQMKIIQEDREEKSVDKPMEFGVAISKIIRVGDGVVLLSAGSTALLYIPLSLLYSTSVTESTETISILELSNPIIDISHPTAASPSTFSLSLDFHNGTAPSTETPIASIRTVELISGQLTLQESTPLQFLATTSTPLITSSLPLPSTESTYSVLSLLYNPDPNPAEEIGETGEGSLKIVEEKKLAKRKAEKLQPSHTGKRAKGRAMTESRLEIARGLKEGVVHEEKME